MLLSDIFKDEKKVENEKFVYTTQNFLTSQVPNFCSTPYWYMKGVEKRVKIGRKSFNAVDYLEAWCNIDCYTYRSIEALERIYLEIRKAFSEIDNYRRKR